MVPPLTCITCLGFASDSCPCNQTALGQSCFSMDTKSPELLPKSQAFHMHLPLTQKTVFFFFFYLTEGLSSGVMGSTKADPNGLSLKVNLLCLFRAQGRNSRSNGAIASFLTPKEFLLPQGKFRDSQMEVLGSQALPYHLACAPRSEMFKTLTMMPSGDNKNV